MIKKTVCLIIIASMLSSILFVPNCYAEGYATKGKMSENLCDIIENTEKDEKIPVCIWLEEDEEFDIEAEVKTEIGVTKERLDTNYNMSSSELLDSLLKLGNNNSLDDSLNVTQQMKTYLKETSGKHVTFRLFLD